MQILHVITSVDPAGGGPIEAVTQLYRALQVWGHNSEIASLDLPSGDFVDASSLHVHALGNGRSGYSYSPHFAPWLRENHARYDAVIVNGLWQYGGYATWRALRHTQTPYFVFPHGMLDPWFNQTYPLKKLKKSLYWPFEGRVLRDASAVCFTCEEERELARQSFAPYKVNERVVSYGTTAPQGDADAQREAFYAKFADLREKRLLLFLGRIHPKKGCDLLIQAFAEVARDKSDWHLMMAGPDQVGWGIQLQSQAHELGVGERITWPGMLSGDVKWGAFYAARASGGAFVLPSHQENFGIAIAEALACGVPVLISNKINTWREVVACEAGIVVPDTLEGTVQLLSSWIESAPQQQAKLRDNARCCFDRHFEIGAAAKKLLQVIEEAKASAVASTSSAAAP